MTYPQCRVDHDIFIYYLVIYFSYYIYSVKLFFLIIVTNSSNGKFIVNNQ